MLILETVEIEPQISGEDLKLTEIQKDINIIRAENKCAEIVLKFQDGRLLDYHFTDKKRWVD